MSKFILSASLVLAANIAMAATAPAVTPDANSSTMSAKATPGESKSDATSVSTSITKPVSAWRHKMKYEAYYGTWNKMDAINKGNNSGTGVDLYAQAMRDIGKGQALGLRMNGAQNQTNEDPNDKYETKIVDPQIMYKNPVGQTGVRLSLPVSEVSRKIGRYELRYNTGMDVVDSGRFTMNLGFEQRAYAYSKDATGQRYARTRFLVSPNYKISRKVTFTSAFIYDMKFNKNGAGYLYLNPDTDLDATRKPAEKLADFEERAGLVHSRALDRHAVIDLGFSIDASPSFNIAPYVEQDLQFEKMKADSRFLGDDTTSYNLEFTLSI